MKYYIKNYMNVHLARGFGDYAVSNISEAALEYLRSIGITTSPKKLLYVDWRQYHTPSTGIVLSKEEFDLITLSLTKASDLTAFYEGTDQFLFLYETVE